LFRSGRPARRRDYFRRISTQQKRILGTFLGCACQRSGLFVGHAEVI
jgi:hypothetical protein